MKRLSLTDIKIDIQKVPKKKTLIEAMEAAGMIITSLSRTFWFYILFGVKLNHNFCADVKNKWENSSWGRKLIVQKRRAALNDFDRFKIMLAKIKVCFY